MCVRWIFPVIVVLLLPAMLRAAAPNIPAGMKSVEGKYHYLIHDLDDAQAREVLFRMEAMVDEYAVRTRDFSGKLNRKLPFLLFTDPADYYRHGGLEGSAGVFTGETLMAIAGEKITPTTWRVIQHEGFHQFADAVIGGDMPIWVNEGLAEYFGEAVYTGDGFISGAIPAYRLKRLQEGIKQGKFKSIQKMMELTLAQWNRELEVDNYDQAWAMVLFLAHGEDGKYQPAFGKFMLALNRHVPWAKAWQEAFGSADGFQERWSDWWSSKPPNASIDIYARAATQTLTSYLARATSQKQTFADLDALLAGIETGAVKWNRSDALPPGLGEECVKLVRDLRRANNRLELAQIPINSRSKLTQPAVICTLEDGTTITGTFKTRNTRVAGVETTIEKPKNGKP